jgi:DNA-binding LytR/AlgR family response regulator
MAIKPMNCIIIEDYDESRKLVEIFVEKTRMLNLVGSYGSAVEAINDNNLSEKVDLVFLDIELPEMSGMEYLKTLEESPVVIILSAQEKYALEAFQYDVTDYILKPITYARFYKAVSKAYSHWRRQNNVQKAQNDIFIKKGNSLVKLSYEDIVWIESMENYVLVVTSKEKIVVHFTLKAILQKLPADVFLQTHRSHIVNLNKIDAIKRSSLILREGIMELEVPVGKSYRDQLLSSLNLMSH